MIATLSRSQADLPRLVELASQGESVVITVAGQPRARLTRANGEPVQASPVSAARLRELADLREKGWTGKTGVSVDQILGEVREDRG